MLRALRPELASEWFRYPCTQMSGLRQRQAWLGSLIDRPIADVQACIVSRCRSPGPVVQDCLTSPSSGSFADEAALRNTCSFIALAGDEIHVSGGELSNGGAAGHSQHPSQADAHPAGVN